MPKTDPSFDPQDYAPVALRIWLFHQKYELGRIITRLISYENGRAIVEAAVYRFASDAMPSATGLASERECDGDVNAVACLENTETSAIGRALANLGFTASRLRPSREEMEKALRARPSNLQRHGAIPAPSAEPAQRVAEGEPTAGGLQELAAEHLYVVKLLRRAERAGLPAERARALRSALEAAERDAEARDRIALELRGWLRRRTDPLRATPPSAASDNLPGADVRTRPL